MHTLKPHRLTFSLTIIISFKLTPTDSPFIQFTSCMHVDCRHSPPSLICPIPYKPAIVVAPSVLSFVVAVNPGHGKEPWKVEKMYSDVTALDQRVKNSVGKSVSKRIASLPEGKFWKDHAPAKVDQRKVCDPTLRDIRLVVDHVMTFRPSWSSTSKVLSIYR